jgi:MFS family permease
VAEAVSSARPDVAHATRRSVFGTTVITGHILKHLYIAGLSATFLPEIKLGLGFSNAQIGTLGSVQQFSGWGATMAAGYLGDRFTNKTGVMLALSLIMLGTGFLFLGSFDNYVMLAGAMLIVGIGVSSYHPPALGGLARRFPDRRSLMIMLHGAGGSVGEVTGPLLAPVLIGILYWQDVLQISFIPAVIAALLMWRLLRTAEASETGGAASFGQYVLSILVLLRRRAIVLICLVSGLRSVGQSTVSVFLPLYLREDLGYSAGLVGLYIALAQVAGIGAQPLMGVLADRFSHKRVLVPALASFALLLALLTVADGKTQLVLVILALGAFLFSLHAMLIAMAVGLAEREVQATTVSLIYASSFIGALAPTIAGLLADAYGLQSTFLFASCLVLTATLVLVSTHVPKPESASSG